MAPMYRVIIRLRKTVPIGTTTALIKTLILTQGPKDQEQEIIAKELQIMDQVKSYILDPGEANITLTVKDGRFTSLRERDNVNQCVLSSSK